MPQMTRLPSAWLVTGVLVLLFALAATTTAQTPPIWGDLEPGAHAVGFGTIEKYDYSRTLRPEKDYFGDPLEGESARPIQVCYWYPAQPDAGRVPMVFGEYAFPYPEDASFFDLLGNLQNRELGTIFFFMGNNQGLVLNSMSTEFYAARDATPADGRFPLIIYHHDARSGFGQNAVLCEFLASHGFIVAATHALGATDIAVGDSGEDFLTVLRDKELIADLLRDLPGIDLEKVGLLGLGNGASTALVHQMSNFSVDAVATLQADFLLEDGFERLRERTFFDPLQMTVPWLQLYAESPEQPLDLRVMDSLRYTTRYSMLLKTVSPMEFSSYSLMAALQAPDTVRPFETISSGYGMICQSVVSFFDAMLNDDPAAWAWIESLLEGPEPDFFVCTMTQAESVPPTEAQFVAMMRNRSLDQTQEVVERFGLADPEHPIMAAQNFTGLGYQFLQRGRIPEALAVFEWGVTAYPAQANAWDSFGEACFSAGDVEKALANYRKALELLPLDTTLTDGFRETLQTSIPTAIEQLEEQLAEKAGSSSAGD